MKSFSYIAQVPLFKVGNKWTTFEDRFRTIYFVRDTHFAEVVVQGVRHTMEQDYQDVNEVVMNFSEKNVIFDFLDEYGSASAFFKGPRYVDQVSLTQDLQEKRDILKLVASNQRTSIIYFSCGENLDSVRNRIDSHGFMCNTVLQKDQWIKAIEWAKKTTKTSTLNKCKTNSSYLKQKLKKSVADFWVWFANLDNPSAEVIEEVKQLFNPCRISVDLYAHLIKPHTKQQFLNSLLCSQDARFIDCP